MDKLLQNKLEKIAEDLSEEGFEEAIMNNLTSDDHADLESMLNHEISITEDKIEFQKFIQLRHLFRIILKFHTDIHRGMNRLREFETNP